MIRVGLARFELAARVQRAVGPCADHADIGDRGEADSRHAGGDDARHRIVRTVATEQLPQQVASALLSITDNKILLLVMINIFLIFIGMIMDELSGILLTVPLLYPVILKIGVDPIHFASIIGVNLGMGMMTPPMAGIMYIGARVANITIDKMMKPTLVLIFFCFLPMVVITTYWPDLSLFLPRLAGFIH